MINSKTILNLASNLGPTSAITTMDSGVGLFSKNTNYQNTTGKPMFCNASFFSSVINEEFSIYIDDFTTPTTIRCHFLNSSAHETTLFIVLPNHYYRWSSSSGSSLLSFTRWY